MLELFSFYNRIIYLSIFFLSTGSNYYGSGMRMNCAFRENVIQAWGAIFAQQNSEYRPECYYERPPRPWNVTIHGSGMRIYCAFRDNVIQAWGAIFAQQNSEYCPECYYERPPRPWIVTDFSHQFHQDRTLISPQFIILNATTDKEV